MPAARQSLRSLFWALAVIAMMVRRWPLCRSSSRMRQVAIRPSMTGICMSIRIRSKSASPNRSKGFLAIVGDSRDGRRGSAAGWPRAG